MSLPAIRAALETALAAMSPALATAHENVDFTPVPGTPYQAVYLIPATPADIVMGNGFFVEQGVLQVSLFYPLDDGPGAAEARAELIRATFYRGATFAADGVTVHIPLTPEIFPAMTDDDRRMVPVRVRYLAQITRS